jgi:hypothetical protein
LNDGFREIAPSLLNFRYLGSDDPKEKKFLCKWIRIDDEEIVGLG